MHSYELGMNHLGDMVSLRSSAPAWVPAHAPRPQRRPLTPPLSPADV